MEPKVIFLAENFARECYKEEANHPLKYISVAQLKEQIENNKWISNEGMVYAINVRELLNFINT